MGDYLRTTRECTLNNLDTGLKTAVDTHIEKYSLEKVLDTTLTCCETTSTKQKKRLFKHKKEVVISAIILTPTWLIFTTRKEDEPATVFMAQLHELRIEDYEKSSMYKMIPDSGFTIFGFNTADGPGSVFFGLGSELAAQKFKETLTKTIIDSL